MKVIKCGNQYYKWEVREVFPVKVNTIEEATKFFDGSYRIENLHFRVSVMKDKENRSDITIEEVV